jgi:hypothetical protein
LRKWLGELVQRLHDDAILERATPALDESPHETPVSAAESAADILRTQPDPVTEQDTAPGSAASPAADKDPVAETVQTTEPLPAEEPKKKKPAKGRPLNRWVEARRKVIGSVAHLEGKEYCAALRQKELFTPPNWQNEHPPCPKDYPDAWNHGDLVERKKWRKRISNERYKATHRRLDSDRQNSPDRF